jgi:hypothetical protein
VSFFIIKNQELIPAARRPPAHPSHPPSLDHTTTSFSLSIPRPATSNNSNNAPYYYYIAFGPQQQTNPKKANTKKIHHRENPDK